MMATKLFSSNPDQWIRGCIRWILSRSSSEIHSIGGVSHNGQSVGSKWRRISWNPLTINSLSNSFTVFVEPSQWEVGSRRILHSPADWGEHFICSGTQSGLVKSTHISVYFCSLGLCVSVSLHEVHFDHPSVGVRGTLVSQHSLVKFPNISILRLC